jgi:hypothetical protein
MSLQMTAWSCLSRDERRHVMAFLTQGELRALGLGNRDLFASIGPLLEAWSVGAAMRSELGPGVQAVMLRAQEVTLRGFNAHWEHGGRKLKIIGKHASIGIQVPFMPEVRLFYADGWDAVGFYQKPVIYANMACWKNCPAVYSSKKEWLKVLVHETAHVLVGPHNDRFADLVLNISMLFVEL